MTPLGAGSSSAKRRPLPENTSRGGGLDGGGRGGCPMSIICGVTYRAFCIALKVCEEAPRASTLTSWRPSFLTFSSGSGASSRMTTLRLACPLLSGRAIGILDCLSFSFSFCPRSQGPRVFREPSVRYRWSCRIPEGRCAPWVCHLHRLHRSLGERRLTTKSLMVLCPRETDLESFAPRFGCLDSARFVVVARCDCLAKRRGCRRIECCTGLARFA